MEENSDKKKIEKSSAPGAVYAYGIHGLIHPLCEAAQKRVAESAKKAENNSK